MKSKDYPKILYKYLFWSNECHRKIITENRLYVSSPIDFNDPIDFRIGNNYSLLDTDEKIQKYAKIITTRNRNKLIEMGLDPNQEKERIINELKTDLNSVQKADDENIFKLQDKHFGIL